MERIHVSVRARPLSPEDATSSPWRISGSSIFMPNQPAKFDFDRIFEENSATSEVYGARTKDIVAAVVRGFNGTVFAYGQTSSGKTHTMRGSTSEPGVIPLAVHELFNIIHEEGDREFLLRMSYMEIYNEEINDLLVPEHRRLQIHESIEKGIFVAGLREEIVASAEQVLGLMDFGEAHRHIGETNMNVYSSRSHTIFRMIVESREKKEGTDSDNSCDAVRVSVLNLVDLAGSERAAKTGAEGVRLKEGSHINKSLMTLGTVIKKLSEGVESQGGHVPYRDSKLTRILQPALGGNANTAIICNITLAQAHADETKSSLQFASRALRVTNCVHVNEILTDAALLKRQKKEIEELRSKLLGSHSEHLEEEILSLRNNLLKVELERERMALELEEEKKAQAECEKRLEEQAKRIRNLSSMVFCSSKTEINDISKAKRRETWCPSHLSKETISELKSEIKEKASVGKPAGVARYSGPLLPFEELDEAILPESFKKLKEEETSTSNLHQDSVFPSPLSLLHVTSRKKLPTKKRCLPQSIELEEMQAEYEDLFVQLETEKTMNQIQVDYLRRRLAEADLFKEKCQDNFTMDNSVGGQIGNSEAILVIKQLQEKITMLEMEKSSNEQNLDCLVKLATEQTISAKQKYDELHATLLDAQEGVKLANEQLTLMPSNIASEEDIDQCRKLQMEIRDLVSEIETTRDFIATLDDRDHLKYLYSLGGIMADLKSSFRQASLDVKTMITQHQKLKSYMQLKVDGLESEKVTLCNEVLDLHNQIAALSMNAENSAKALSELSEQYELEKSEFVSHIQALQNEILCLSTGSLAKEKESVRKELEKTKSKLRDTESKMKNAMQERTKLEGEKACIEKENKLLRGQKAVLERDISKRDPVVGRSRDSIVDRNSNLFDPKRGKGLATVDQEEYKKLEVLAFEMETTIAALEEQLSVVMGEKEESIMRAESLISDMATLDEELKMSYRELATLKEEVSSLRFSLEEYKSTNRGLEGSLSALMQEKELFAMQLTDALLLMEEEKAIWSSKEKASVKAIEDKSKSHIAEMSLLQQKISAGKEELEICRNQSKALEERLTLLEKATELEKKCSKEKSVEIDRLKEDLLACNTQSERTQETLGSQLEMLTSKHEYTCDQLENLQQEFLGLKKEREDLIAQLATLEAKLHTSNDHKGGIIGNKEMVKLRMRLHYAQLKLDAYRYRHKEALDEMDVMNGRYEAASNNLKKQLATCAGEVMKLKRELAAERNSR